MNPLPDLAITIVSYDSAKFLPECLKTLLENTASYLGKAKIVLVENGDAAAQARTREAIKPFANAENLQFLVAPRNLGYAGGTNLGWQQLEGAIYLVLNPDMSFQSGWLEKLIRPFVDKPEVGIVGCKLLTADGKIQHAGGLLLHGTLLGEHFGAGEPDDGRWDESTEVEFVTGAALAIRRELKEQVGGFDPGFFPGYFEDVYLCWQARQLGYKVWYEAGAVAYHYEGGSFGRKARYYEAFHRNRLRFALKTLGTRQFFNEFLPAERRRLALTPPGTDLATSMKVYRNLNNNHNGANMLEDENPVGTRLPSRLTEVKQNWLVKEKPFQSRLPFVAKLRERFNNISTRWYVQPILQQQVDYNASVARAIEDMGQLTLAQEAGQTLATSSMAERMVQLEERLLRIETLLETLLKQSVEGRENA